MKMCIYCGAERLSARAKNSVLTLGEQRISLSLREQREADALSIYLCADASIKDVPVRRYVTGQPDSAPREFRIKKRDERAWRNGQP